MLGLPKSTEFNRRIPKQKFYENLSVTPALKRVFIDQIKVIYWRNKIAATTMNLAAGETVTQSPWRVEPLPAGFVKVLHNRTSAGVAGRSGSEHMVFADGLATVSVFLEALQEGATPLLQGESRLGLMNAYGTVVDGHQVLVVGEVPAVTVQRIAAALHRDPAEK